MSEWFSMTVADVAQATGGRVAHGAADSVCSRVTTDSRSAGEGDLFVALVGDKFDGHDFIEAALSQGVSGIVCETGRYTKASGDGPEGAVAKTNGVAWIEVPDTLRALGDIAHAHRAGFDAKIIAVTGSNGKTTTKEMLRGVLKAEYGSDGVLATRGNLNNLIGVPLTLFGLGPEHKVAVVEMGMNAPGEIARLTEIADPDVGLITCVGEAHLEGLGSVEGVARAKGELFDGLREDAVAVVNLDDALVAGLAHRPDRARVYYTSAAAGGEAAGERLVASEVCTRRLDGSSFTLEYGGRTAVVELPLGGRHNVMNAVGAAAVGVAVGLDLDVVARGLALTDPPPMRMSPEALPNGVLLVNDAYNANPASFRAALDVMAQGAAGARIVVLGDMLELGPDAARWHGRAGAETASIEPLLLCALGEHAHDVVAGALDAGLPKERTRVCVDRDEAARAVVDVWGAGATVLVKGSRGSAMEKVVEALRQEATQS